AHLAAVIAALDEGEKEKSAGVKADACKISEAEKVRATESDDPRDWEVTKEDQAEAGDYCSSTSTATEVSDESDGDGEEGVDYISLDKLTPELLSQAVLGAKAAFDAVLKVKKSDEKPGETPPNETEKPGEASVGE